MHEKTFGEKKCDSGRGYHHVTASVFGEEGVSNIDVMFVIYTCLVEGMYRSDQLEIE